MSKEITTILILTAAQKQQMLNNPTQLSNLIKNILWYHIEYYKHNQQLLIDLHTERMESAKDQSEYAS
jgi:hypothetical protein